MPKEKKKKENFLKRKKPLSGEFIWHFLLGLWMLGIFIASGIEGSGERYFDLRMLIERKGAHIFEFFVLAYLFWKALSFYALEYRKKIWLAFLFPLFYASWDEVHQLFVFGREGKILDISIDLMGIVFFIISLQLAVGFRETKKPT